MSVVTLSVNNSERGTVTGGGTYDVGSQITVTANNNSGYFFACWSDGSKVVSDNPSYTFEVKEDITLTAFFYNEIDSVKIYGLCGANCKHQVLSIGQTISLIQEMAKSGFEVPTGFIPSTAVNSVVEQNKGSAMSIFVGTQKEWNDWTGDKTNVVAALIDDPTTAKILQMLSDFSTVKTYVTGLENGSNKAKKAENADNADNSTKVNNLEIKQDENGVLKIGDIIIPQKKLIYSGKTTSSVITLPQTLKKGEKFEIVLKFVDTVLNTGTTAITIINGYVQSIERNASNQTEILVYTIINKAKSTLNGSTYTDEDIKIYGTADSTGGVNALHIENASIYEEIKIYKIIE